MSITVENLPLPRRDGTFKKLSIFNAVTGLN
jgi:hypothetical protein